MAKFKFYFLWLSLICIALFAFQKFIPGFTELFILNNSALYSMEYWRFISAIFLHRDIIHLLYNLFALLFFGIILEKKIGGNRFLIVFFISGIIANIIAVNFYSSSLGASGAIYGIIGCLAILDPFMFVWAFGLLMPMFIAAILWTLGDVIGLFIPSDVGNIAHISGIGFGVLLGILFRTKIIKNNEKKQVKQVFPEEDIRRWEDFHIR
jgi:uncharacterized protein